jgi:hypothetical protein
VGAECYVYGYALVIMDITRRVLTAVPRPNLDGTAAPINQFARMPHYVSPDFKNVVRISLNSLWTTGFIDVQREPIVLSVPDTAGRYNVFSVMDMWTNVFASLDKRTTGTGPGAFLFVGRNWNGTAPSDICEVFHCPTRYAWVLGQTQCDGEQEFAAVNRLQAQYKLTPLSAWGHPYEPLGLAADPGVPLDVTPVDQVARMDAGAFFGRLGPLMGDFYDADGELLSGDGRYVLRFERGQFSPTNATWSVSQYVGNFYVRNLLNRYAIRPSMLLTYGQDGSLEIYFQAHSPGGDKEANWLSVPSKETFNVTIRDYWPMAGALDGSYKVPPIKRVG